MWQPHQIWGYGPMKSATFHGFGLGWLIGGTITPEPYKLWTWDLHHWTQQRLRFKGFVVPNLLNPISSEHETCCKDWCVIMCDFTYSWSLHGFGSHPWVNLCRHHYNVNPITTTLYFNPARIQVYIVFMWNGIPHNDHTSFTPHPHPSPQLYPHNICLFLILEPCYTNLTFLLTLCQHGTPKLLTPVLLSHVLLLICKSTQLTSSSSYSFCI